MGISTNSFAVSAKAADLRTERNYWIYNKQWDLIFIILSASLIALPLVLNLILHNFVGISQAAVRTVVALAVTVAVGGPHMYATFTRTAMEKSFIKTHPKIMVGSLLIPVGVIWLGLSNFIILLTVFFFWASIHVLHQIVYLVECYNTKSPKTLSVKSRVIDYAVVLTSLYPLAFRRMVRGTFVIGSNKMPFPEVLRGDWFWMLFVLIFVVFLVLFTKKTVQEVKEGTVLWPKVLLIYVTAFSAFLIPTFHDLDVAFQGMNTWHSFQYLGLTWYINRLRSERGEISSSFVKKISRKNNNGIAFYLTVVAVTVSTVAIIMFLQHVVGLSKDQSYYITVLTFLLMHYLHDHVLFTDTDVLQVRTA
ncbi:MAG: hypothetical protein ACE5HO_01545 [bacterium]